MGGGGAASRRPERRSRYQMRSPCVKHNPCSTPVMRVMGLSVTDGECAWAAGRGGWGRETGGTVGPAACVSRGAWIAAPRGMRVAWGVGRR